MANWESWTLQNEKAKVAFLDFMQRERLHNARVSQCTFEYCIWLLTREITRGQ